MTAGSAPRFASDATIGRRVGRSERIAMRGVGVIHSPAEGPAQPAPVWSGAGGLFQVAFSLGLYRPGTGPCSSRRRAPAGATVRNASRPMSRILIVEDEPGLSRGLSNGLSDEGYAVDIAADGRRALVLLGTHTYDL